MEVTLTAQPQPTGWYVEVNPNEHAVWMSSDITISEKRLAKYTALMRTVRKTWENFKILREEFHLL
jgi:hypothetical protein